jgi:hypothetical protein
MVPQNGGWCNVGVAAGAIRHDKIETQHIGIETRIDKHMTARRVTLDGIISEDGKLIIEVPPEVLAGRMEVTLRAARVADSDEAELSHDVLDARLRAAGLLEEDHELPPGAGPLSDDERDRIGRILAEGGPSLQEMIDEEREERF